MKRKRRFVDADPDRRCGAIVYLRDGSSAQCGRRKKFGHYCTQHAKISAKTGRII